MSSYFLLEYQADWTGDESVIDPRALLIGVHGVVDELPYSGVVDEIQYDMEVDESVYTLAVDELQFAATVAEDVPVPGVVVQEGNQIAVVDESRYVAVVTIPGKLIAKVDEWPS